MEARIKEMLAKGLYEPGIFDSVEELEGDASTRRYFRVKVKGKEREGNFTAVMMRYPDTHVIKGELLFLHVHGYLKTAGVKVPEVYLHVPEGNLLFLEDAGDRTLESLVNEEGFSRKTVLVYESALIELVKIQGKATRLLDSSSIPSKLYFDVEKFMEEMNFFVKWGIDNCYGEEGKFLGARFLELIEPVIEEISRLPRFLAHRDYHSRNIMVLDDGDIRILDFQDARMGTIFYDLASLLLDSYVSLPEGTMENLLERYATLAKEVNLPVGDSMDETWRNLWLTAIQRNVKALGTFFYMFFGRGKDKYLSSIPTTIDHLRKNPVLNEEHEKLAKFILPLLEEMNERIEGRG